MPGGGSPNAAVSSSRPRCACTRITRRECEARSICAVLCCYNGEARCNQRTRSYAGEQNQGRLDISFRPRARRFPAASAAAVDVSLAAHEINCCFAPVQESPQSGGEHAWSTPGGWSAEHIGSQRSGSRVILRRHISPRARPLLSVLQIQTFGSSPSHERYVLSECPDASAMLSIDRAAHFPFPVHRPPLPASLSKCPG